MSLWHPSLAPKIQTGSYTTDTNGNATITFTTPFPTTPKVLVQGKDANAKGIIVDIVSVSQTSFTVKARKATGITTSTTGSHSHSFTPSGTISSAGSHSHSFTPSGSIGTPSAYTDVTDFITWQTCPNNHSNCQLAGTYLINVATYDHTHTFTGGSGSTDSAGSHSHTFTGSSGTTGSTGDHSHTVDAPVLQIDFDWVAVAM